MDDMPRRLDKNVVREISRHGKVTYYFRVDKGPRIRLPEPGSKDYQAAYRAALTGTPLTAPSVSAKSLSWLIARYMESAAWAGLSAATRKQRGLLFKTSIQNSGNADFRAITSKDIRNALEARKATPSLANNFLKAMRGLFGWARINEHVAVDPSIEVMPLRIKTKGFPAWTVEDSARYCDCWQIGTQARLAFELLLHSGLRRSDICRAGRQHLRGREFQITTAKTGSIITVEFSDYLLDVVSQTKTGDLHFIVGEKGQPFTVESFGNWFRHTCRQAGIMKSAHGIRKLSATMAANGGATTHELMAMYGWKTVSQAEVYTKGADRARLGLKSSRMVSEQIADRLSPYHIAGAGIIRNKSTKSTTKK